MVTSLLFPLSLLLLLSSIGHGSTTAAEKFEPMTFDGCPMEASGRCTQLAMEDNQLIDCPHKLWYGKPQLIYHTASNTTSVSTAWHPTPYAGLSNGGLSRMVNETHGRKLDPGTKVICSEAVPEVSLEAFITGDDTTERFFCHHQPSEQGSDDECENGYCIHRGQTKECHCHVGWNGSKCDVANDPFGDTDRPALTPEAKPEQAVEDTCNIRLAEGCPDEAIDDCIKLQFVEEKRKQFAYCPRKLWLSEDDSWEEIDNLSCENNRWKIESKSGSNGAFLEPRRRVRCAHNQPSSVGLQRSTLMMYTLNFYESSIFCYGNSLKCENGGYCMHSQLKRGPEINCECGPRYRGKLCEEKDSKHSRESLFGLLLLNGCPYEEIKEGRCWPLTFDEIDDNGRQKVLCPFKLWSSDSQLIYHVASITTSLTNIWSPIDQVSRHLNSWWIRKPNQTGDYRMTDGVQKVICARDRPENIPVIGFDPIVLGERVNDSRPFLLCGESIPFSYSGFKGCEHGYCVSLGTKEPSCQCHFGWRGDRCEIAFDPFGYENSSLPVPRFAQTPDMGINDRCNILLAEGCPDELTSDCIKLRLIRDYSELLAYCPRKLWLSTDQSWEPIDKLICNYSLATWNIQSNSSSNGTILMPQSRVRCAHEKPTTLFYDLQRATDIQHTFGLVDLSSTFFCFHNSLKCENGGQCLHTLRKNEPMETFCSCGSQFSGDRCETANPAIFPSCSPLLVEGCAREHNGTLCERLNLDVANKAADCPEPNTLWASDAQLVYNSYSLTHSTSSNWTIIDKLWCKNNNWQISREGQETTVTLGRKVVCAKSTPRFDADAFWEHRSFIPTPTNFALMKPGPLAYCTEEEGKWCHSERSYCVRYYKDEKFVPSCYCKFGYTGELCDQFFDPYGFERYSGEEVAPKTERKPDTVLDSCNILLAEGCPDMRTDNCVKLRYYNSGAICHRKLWVSRYSSYRMYAWEEIDGLSCTKEGWEVLQSSKKELLDYKMRVQCSWNAPITNVTGLSSTESPHWEEKNNTRETSSWLTFFCMWNINAEEESCHNGNHCFNTPSAIAPEEFRLMNRIGRKQFSNILRGFECVCTDHFDTHGYTRGRKWHWDGELCDELDIGLPRSYDHPSYPYNYGKPKASVYRGDNTTNVIEICDPSDLEDGCNDKNCKKLKANSTHVKCSEQLWLNYGSEFLLDWHEISGVKCTNNEWKSECSKKIGRSHLICSSSSPSSISSHLWMLISVAVLVIIIAIGLTCVVCLMTRRRRKVAQALVDARMPHSSRCVSSTQNSEMTTREEE